MTQADQKGKVLTVLGPVDADTLGITLPHEHILHDSTGYYIEPADSRDKILARQPVTLANLNWILHQPFSNIDNMRNLDLKRTIDELLEFKEAGGATIVDHTIRGLHPKPEGLIRIARATGLNVVTATGYYVAITHSDDMKKMTVNEIADQLVRDVTQGIEGSGAFAGLLKCACGGPASDTIEASEEKVFYACALAQRRTGAAIGVHNMRGDLVPAVLDILIDAGADLSRTIMMHADRWGPEPAIFPKLLQSGCYLELDGFGTAELGVIPPRRFDYQFNDAQRCDMVKRLISEGHISKILISQDVWVKTRHSSFGGAGYAHILCQTVPLMRSKGISEQDIHTIMEDNPKTVLAFGLKIED